MKAWDGVVVVEQVLVNLVHQGTGRGQEHEAEQ